MSTTPLRAADAAAESPVGCSAYAGSDAGSSVPTHRASARPPKRRSYEDETGADWEVRHGRVKRQKQIFAADAETKAEVCCATAMYAGCHLVSQNYVCTCVQADP